MPAHFADHMAPRVLPALLICLLLAVMLVGLLPFGAVHAQPLSRDDIDSYITGLMQQYGIPGAAVALIKDGKIAYTQGYGVRSITTHEPVTENTLFSIGSISKPFTALAVAQLVDAHRLSLDDLLIKYVPEFTLRDTVSRQLTIRHLLAQTSGLPRADDLWWPNGPTNRQQVINDLRNVRLVAAPGQQFSYSNQNYVLLGWLIERVTGQSWETYVQDHIFTPLSMKTAGFDPFAMQHMPDHASPHILDEHAGMTVLNINPADARWIAAHGPAVSIDASVQDMARFAQAQLRADTNKAGDDDGPLMVSPAMQKEMVRPQIVVPPSEPLITQQGYGLGWFTEMYRGWQLAEHSGDVRGFSANITLVPSARAGVVILTNMQNVEMFRQAVRLRMIEYLLGLPADQDIADTLNKFHRIDPVERLKQFEAARLHKTDPSFLQKLVGTYDGLFGKTRIELQGSRLLARREGWLVVYELSVCGPDQVLYAAGSLTDSLVLNLKINERGATFYLDDRPALQRVAP